jgi:hypothetical protein
MACQPSRARPCRARVPRGGVPAEAAAEGNRGAVLRRPERPGSARGGAGRGGAGRRAGRFRPASGPPPPPARKVSGRWSRRVPRVSAQSPRCSPARRPPLAATLVVPAPSGLCGAPSEGAAVVPACKGGGPRPGPAARRTEARAVGVRGSRARAAICLGARVMSRPQCRAGSPCPPAGRSCILPGARHLLSFLPVTVRSRNHLSRSTQTSLAKQVERCL